MLQANVDLFPSVGGTNVEISNLLETRTTSNALLPIYGNCTRAFGTSASWAKNPGILKLRLKEQLLINTSCEVNFDLQNPDAYQKAPNVMIRIEGGDTPMSYDSMDKAAMNAAPLFIAGFSTALVEQSDPVANHPNTINFTFIGNNPLFGIDRSKIVISGIMNGITPSTSVPLFSNTHDVNSVFSDGQNSGRGIKNKVPCTLYLRIHTYT
jgi:hypothetical protein